MSNRRSNHVWGRSHRAERGQMAQVFAPLTEAEKQEIERRAEEIRQARRAAVEAQRAARLDNTFASYVRRGNVIDDLYD